MENVFEISNLKCSYDGRNHVLLVDELNIPKGKLTILLGLSGSGKSTLLETLGLMNNTLSKDSFVKYYSSQDLLEYSEIWNKREEYVAGIRNKYFSFIFQNTNLMPGFTAYENVAVTQLLQGISLDQAMQKAEYYMNVMGLEEVTKEKMAYELAGGQKQRLAFVRAITPGFDVLFADEPTGNLDRKNARELMNQLRNQVQTLKKTSIIVTHDLILALEFADQIVVIDKKNGIGKIKKEHIIIRSNDNLWVDQNNHMIDIKHKLKDLLGYDE